MTNTNTKYASTFAAAAVIAATWVPDEARAQQWSALDRQPRPNNIVAVDSSMTMATNLAGNWDEFGNNRLRRAQTLLTGYPGAEENGAMYLFRDQFAWGGFSYSSSIEAHIKDGRGSLPHLGSVPDTREPPIWNDRVTSYVRTRNMINGLRVDYCLTTGKNAYNCLEQRLPGGGAGPACITAGCAYDQPLLEHLTQNPIAGLSLPVLPNPPGYSVTSTIYPAGWPRYTFACDNRNPAGYPDNPTTAPLPAGCPRTSPSQPYNPACPVVNIPYEIAHELGGAYYQWPRFTDTDGDGVVDVQASVVAQDICNPLRNAYTKIQAKLSACMLNPPTLSPPFSCSPGTLAPALCAGSSPFQGGLITPINGSPVSIPATCVCNANGPGCVSGGGNDACGNPLYYPARQQVAICHSHNTGDQPARDTASLPADDNILRDPAVHTPMANPDRYCRSSAVTFVTDGLGTNPLGLASTNPRNQRFYFADFAVPQNNVLGMGGATQISLATAIQSVIRGMAPPGAAAIDGDGAGVDALRARFSRDLNRSLKGVYAAAAPSLSQFQDRAAFMVMEVPGSASPSHLDYLGRPMRLEWWEMNPSTGLPVRPLFSTDEAARAVINPVNGPFNTLAPYAGPNGTWRSGMSKTLLVGANVLDRDGDGTPDAHPPVRWGYHLGGEGSRPVIVGAPLDAPEGVSRSQFAAWKQNPVVMRRDRVAYALSNGYLHAYRVGRVSSVRNYTSPGALSPVGNIDVGVEYDDNPAAAGMGSEIFRYRPAFITQPSNASSQTIGGQPRYMYNDVLQQPLIDRGQMFVRDVQLTKPVFPAVPRFATVLVMSQGAAGRGLAALDISNPNAPSVLWDSVRMAPGALALAAPTIYMWPDPAGGDPIPVVVVVGGALTPPPVGAPRVDTVYVYRVVDGSLLTSASLPLNGGRQRAWPNTPACVDRDGAGRADRCYVLASDGTLAELRVTPASGAFSAAVDVTPASGIRGRGLTFNSGLTAYFTGNNRVALVFGSGDTTRIERGDGVANSVFKVIMDGRGAAASSAGNLGTSCRPNAALVNGEIPLRPGEMVVSPPIVGKGAVAFSSYLPGTTGCMDGQSFLYAFDFETCRDVLVPPAATPPLRKPLVGQVTGAGLPSSPVLLRQSGKLLAYASSTPSGAGAVTADVRTRGGAFETVKPLFFRIRSSSR